MEIVTRLLKENEVSQILGCHVQTLRNQRFAGTGIPYIKLGRSVRYDQTDVWKHIDDRRIIPHTDKP